MRKSDLVEAVSRETGLTKVETEAVVNGVITTIIDALSKGISIEIRGFGSFKVKEKQARVARNPRTGEKIDVPERCVPVFKPSKELKKIVDEGNK